MAATTDTAETVRAVAAEKYKYGFVTEIESETAPKGRYLGGPVTNDDAGGRPDDECARAPCQLFGNR